MSNGFLRIDGGFVYWSLAEFSQRQILANGFEALNLSKFTPEPRTPESALKDALSANFRGQRWNVTRLSERDAFEVVEVSRRSYPEANVRTLSLLARISPDGNLEFSTHDDRAESILEKFQLHKGYLRRNQVAAALVQILYHLGGTAPRPQGGLYWLPAAKLPAWQTVVQALEHSAVSGSHCVHLVRHQFDADSIRAVLTAITEEVQTDAAKIMEEVDYLDPITGKGLGKRALETRCQQALSLSQKVQEYESILGVNLSNLIDVVKRAELAAAKAGFLQAVPEELEEATV